MGIKVTRKKQRKIPHEKLCFFITRENRVMSHARVLGSRTTDTNQRVLLLIPVLPTTNPCQLLHLRQSLNRLLGWA